MAVAKHRGNLAVRERPNSPRWDFQTQKTSCTRTYEGLYADVLNARPFIGSKLADTGSDLLVENVTIEKHPSGKATMVVTLEQNVDPPKDAILDVQPVYELEWGQLERVIEQNPFFKALFPDPAGEIEFTDEKITALNNFTTWENAPDAASKRSAYQALSDDFKKLALKKMRGEVSYMLFAPVARITTQARNITPTNACGIIFDYPPGFGPDDLPQGYKWLSTSDRSTRTGKNGKWSRSREWTGATSFDVDLYSDFYSGK